LSSNLTMNKMLRAKRGALEIFESILSNLSKGPLKKTRLTHRANLDSRLAAKHIGTLVELGLVTKSTRKGSRFIITEKGRDFLVHYYELIKFVNPPGSNNNLTISVLPTSSHTNAAHYVSTTEHSATLV